MVFPFADRLFRYRRSVSLLAVSSIVLATGSLCDANKEALFKRALGRFPNFSFSSVGGSILFGRSVTFENFELRASPDFVFSAECLSVTTSLPRLLLKSKHLFKTVSAENVFCECHVITENGISAVKALRNIKITGGDFRLGRDSDRFDLKLGRLDTSRYGLRISSFFGAIKAEGSLNGRPFRFSDSEAPLKKAGFPSEPVLHAPLVVKHGIHEFLSSVLIRAGREIEFQIDTATLLKACVFLKVPFVFTPNSAIKGEGSGTFSVKMALAPGRRYDFYARLMWDGFSLPRFVADGVGEDQFCVFLQKLFQSRQKCEVQLNVCHRFGQEIRSDRAADTLAFLKIVNSIFSIDNDELY